MKKRTYKDYTEAEKLYSAIHYKAQPFEPVRTIKTNADYAAIQKAEEKRARKNARRKSLSPQIVSN